MTPSSRSPASFLRVLLVGAAFVLAAPSPASAQPGALEGLDAWVERAMEAWEVPGFALAVVQGDSVLYARGYGVTRLGGSEAVDEHTIFAIASTTKGFTTAALAALVDDGLLEWDDPVSRHLPGFELADPYVSRELTVRDLLTHRVGAARLDNLWIASPFDRAEILRRARHLPQTEGFRLTYGYNNILYIAAGEVVGAASGMSWDDFLERRFFGPLGMERSTTRAAVVERRGNAAHSHTRIEGEVHAIPRRDYDAIGGAGAVWSSAHDMAQWIRFHLARGEFEGVQLLDPARFDEMYTPQTVMAIDTASARLHPTNHFAAYALGWRVQDLHGRKVVHHSGSINYTRTHVTMVPAQPGPGGTGHAGGAGSAGPEAPIGIVAMGNLSTSNLQLAVSHWILDALQGRTPEDWSAAYLELAQRSADASERSAAQLEAARLEGVGPSLPLEGYTGRFEDPLFGEMRISREGEGPDAGLVLHYSTEYVADLEPWHQDLFRAVWRRPGAGRTFVHFTLDTRGRVTEAAVDGFADFRRTGDLDGG
jgi:CubicO group peptidase (beta-lactamase class C family)